MKQNNRGLSMILVIAALLATGFIGTILIKMGTSDRLSGVFFSSSESARNAAKSGLTAALVRIGSTTKNEQKAILDSLNKFRKASLSGVVPETIWLKGGSNSYETLSSVEKYRTRIAAFRFENPNDCYITLVSEGIGKGGSKSSAIGVYKLNNLGLETTTSDVPTNAIQMDNGNFEFNCQLTKPFTVNGNTAVKKTMTMNGPGIFNGIFRIDTLIKGTSKEIQQITFGYPTVFDTTAYFAGGMRTNGSGQPNFKGHAGFNGPVEYNSNATFTFHDTSKILFNAGCVGQTPHAHDAFGGIIGMWGKQGDYKSDGAGTRKGLDIFTNKDALSSIDSTSGTKFQLPLAIGLDSKPAPKIFFNRPSIDKIFKPNLKTAKWSDDARFNADTLNAWYENAKKKDSLWNDFLVIQFTPNSSDAEYDPFTQKGSSKFNKKVIILVEDPKVRLYKFYESHMDYGNTCIYLPYYSTNDIVFNQISDFRGFVYCVSSGTEKVTFQSELNLHVKGSLYFSENTATTFNSGQKTVSWDSLVVKELAATGIFNDPSNPVTTKGDLKIAPGKRIEPILLSHGM